MSDNNKNRIFSVRTGKLNKFRPRRKKSIFNLHWLDEGKENHLTLVCETSLPDDTLLTFEVYHHKGALPDKLPSSYDYNREPEGLEAVGEKVTGAVNNGWCRAEWPFPNDTEGELIDPFDPNRWFYIREDLDPFDEDALPDDLDDLLLEDDFRPFVFIVRHGDDWTMSPSPSQKEISLELELDDSDNKAGELTVMGGDGKLKKLAVSKNAVKTKSLPDGPLFIFNSSFNFETVKKSEKPE
ncbi:MAG: hypothetical protein JXA92_14145 [candidate division Zixibacteria bacterium]|nr:hypothetical protein [candidate division Zixibacteria bacterium]